MTSETSETAEFIARIAHALPPATQQILRRLISHSIAAPTQAQLREARLGLLVELIEATGDINAISDRYEQLRSERASQGEEWPSRSQLSRAYGGWLQAVYAATTVSEEAKAGAPSDRGRDRKPRSYTRSDILDAIDRARETLGRWPTNVSYTEWRRVTRHAARTHGHTEAPIPSISTVSIRYGTWSRALQTARQRGSDDN